MAHAQVSVDGEPTHAQENCFWCYLADRLVGSDAVGGGGGPRRSRSSM